MGARNRNRWERRRTALERFPSVQREDDPGWRTDGTLKVVAEAKLRHMPPPAHKVYNSTHPNEKHIGLRILAPSVQGSSDWWISAGAYFRCLVERLPLSAGAWEKNC